MKRPTRVPASSTVSMKSASNMIANGYQIPRRRAPPTVPLKICAIPTAPDDEPGQGGQVNRRPTEQDAGGEGEDDADLDEGGEVIAGGEEQPHRQRGGGEAVDDHRHREGGTGQGEDARPLR